MTRFWISFMSIISMQSSNKFLSEVNLLETQEHWEINKASTLEQLFSTLEIIDKLHLNL